MWVEDRLKDYVVTLVARYGVSRAVGVTTIVAVCLSLSIKLTTCLWLGFDVDGIVLAAVIPLILTPLIGRVAYSGFSDMIKLQAALSREVSRRRVVEERLRRMASTDALTGAFNRRYFLRHAEQEVRRALRHGRSLTLMVLDLDRFKEVNDTHGHDVGDRALRRVAEACRQVMRRHDLLARMGGEEFVILLPETTLSGGQTLAERLRRVIGDISVGGEVGEERGPSRLSVSIGLSQLQPPDDDLNRLLKRADRALYQAKAQGRNQVVAREAADAGVSG
jgi:diguanylate cyclase (GGDEF)-like protein